MVKMWFIIVHMKEDAAVNEDLFFCISAREFSLRRKMVNQKKKTDNAGTPKVGGFYCYNTKIIQVPARSVICKKAELKRGF